MTMREIAFMLVQMGNEVRYTQRQDGGIRITYINGQRFTGSTGNTIARQMVGASISEARIQQLGKIKTPKGKWGHKKLDELSEDIKKQIRKAQRLFKKLGTKAGKPTLRKYRAVLKEYGREEAERRLGQAMRYAMGYAYIDNVFHLVMRISMDAEDFDSNSLRKTAEKVKAKADTFREDWISKCYEWLYDMEQGQISPEECSNRIDSLIS